MITLCFGLPGTGKSTFVRSKPKRAQLFLDLGHNAFRNEEARQKFYRKLWKSTTAVCTVLGNQNVYWDTYPEYFDMKQLLPLINNIRVIFAIPEDIDSIIARVGERDGLDSEFYKLYLKQGHKWQKDWYALYDKWKAMFGKKRVMMIDRYDNLK
jgi:hypothetical protein